MQNSLLRSFAFSVLMLAAGCGGKSEVTGSSHETSGDAGLPGQSADAGVNHSPVEAGTGTQDSGTWSRDAGAMAAPTQTVVPVPTVPSAVPTTDPPPIPTTTSPPIDEPGPPMTIDWSTLQAPEGCLVGAGAGTHDEQCKLEMACDGKAFFSSCMWTGLEYQCLCRGQDFDWNVYAVGADLFEVCQASLDFCRGPSAEDLAAAECVPIGGASDGGDTCLATQNCTRSEEFEPGVEARFEYEERAECLFFEGPGAADDGQWDCGCYREGVDYASFTLPGTATTADACVDAQELCRQFDALVLVPDEGTTCYPPAESFTERACLSRAPCLVAATIDGTRVHVDGDLIVNCDADSDEQWSCNINGPLGTRTVTVDAPGSQLDACRDVAADELQRMQDLEGDPAPPDAGVPPVADAG